MLFRTNPNHILLFKSQFSFGGRGISVGSFVYGNVINSIVTKAEAEKNEWNLSV